MACACKVNKQIEKINKIYGTQETVKTDIRGLVSIFFKKILLFILYIPLIPFFSLYLFKKVLIGLLTSTFQSSSKKLLFVDKSSYIITYKLLSYFLVSIFIIYWNPWFIKIRFCNCFLQFKR